MKKRKRCSCEEGRGALVKKRQRCPYEEEAEVPL